MRSDRYRPPPGALWRLMLGGMIAAYVLLLGVIVAVLLRGDVIWAVLLPLPLSVGIRRVRRRMRTPRAFARLRRDQQQLHAAAWVLAAAGMGLLLVMMVQNP